MGDLVLQLLGVGAHRPELVDPEDPLADATADLAEEDRPLGVDADRDREPDQHRREQGEPERRDHEVDGPLEEARRAREPKRRQTHQRDALDRVDADLLAEDLEQAWDDVDLDAELLELADQLERLHLGLVRERDDHALNVERVDELAQVLLAAEERQVAEVLAALLRTVSTNPTRLMPYSGCASNFRAVSCPTSPAPTMIVFWRYATLRRHGRARAHDRP